jgi:hypothetical protein
MSACLAPRKSGVQNKRTKIIQPVFNPDDSQLSLFPLFPQARKPRKKSTWERKVPPGIVFRYYLDYEKDRDDKNVRKAYYPWRKLSVNEGFYIKNFPSGVLSLRTKGSAFARRYFKQNGVRIRFSVRTTKKGMLCWRVQ